MNDLTDEQKAYRVKIPERLIVELTRDDLEYLDSLLNEWRQFWPDEAFHKLRKKLGLPQRPVP